MTGRIVFRESWLTKKKKRVVKASHRPHKKRRRARPRYPSNKKLVANIVEAFCELVEAVAEVQASSKSRRKKSRADTAPKKLQRLCAQVVQEIKGHKEWCGSDCVLFDPGRYRRARIAYGYSAKQVQKDYDSCHEFG